MSLDLQIRPSSLYNDTNRLLQQRTSFRNNKRVKTSSALSSFPNEQPEVNIFSKALTILGKSPKTIPPTPVAPPQPPPSLWARLPFTTVSTQQTIDQSIDIPVTTATSKWSLPVPIWRPGPSVTESQEEEDLAALVTVAPPPTIAAPTPPQPAISWCGGGIYFFWELGVARFILENYSLKNVTLNGASAGALIAVLLACQVSPKEAVRAAHRLANEAGVFDRPLGLAGVWGELIRNWLRELLPLDAAERCQGRVRIVVTESPTLRLRYLDDFESKEDLIDCLMASVHIPFFLDGRAAFSYKGRQYIDGSLWDFITGGNSELLQCDGLACLIDYFFDDQLQFNRLDFIKLSSMEEVERLMEKGYQYGVRTAEGGGFEKLAPARKSAPLRAVSALSHKLELLFT